MTSKFFPSDARGSHLQEAVQFIYHTSLLKAKGHVSPCGPFLSSYSKTSTLHDCEECEGHVILVADTQLRYQQQAESAQADRTALL